jgi:hypothetical protein
MKLVASTAFLSNIIQRPQRGKSLQLFLPLTHVLGHSAKVWVLPKPRIALRQPSMQEKEPHIAPYQGIELIAMAIQCAWKADAEGLPGATMEVFATISSLKYFSRHSLTQSRDLRSKCLKT